MITRIITSILLVLSCASCTMIDAGYEGILVEQYGSKKGVQEVTLVTGRVTYNPFTEDVYQFPIFVQTIDYDPFTVNAKDGSVFTVDPTISIVVIPGKSPFIFTKYRQPLKEITHTTILNYVKDAFRIQMNKYTTNELISNRLKFEDDVQNTLNEALMAEGFRLEQLTSGLKYPEAIVQAIDAKNKAVQQGMQAENELKLAEARAKIKMIEAETDAKANQLKQSALTPLLIQQEFIEKWDGKTPLYGASPLLMQNLPQH